MEALGIPRGSYVVKVNNRKVLDGVLEAIGLGGKENAAKRLTVLRAIDKLDRLRYEGVRQLLDQGRKDESGDFTKGAELSQDQIASILGIAIASESYLSTDGPLNLSNRPSSPIWRLVREGGSIADDRLCPGPKTPDDQIFCDVAAYINRLGQFVGSSTVGREGIDELLAINSLVRSAGYGTNRIEVNASVVRGLEYYTGPVYEVELTLETKDDKGRSVRFGSVGGGGRYDGLVARFRGEPVPATGFSIGVSRLLAALQHIGKIDAKPDPGPVVVTVFDRDRIADYQRMVAVLRNAGIRAELYLGNPKHSVGQQLKYADKRHSPCVVIQGGDEKARGEVQIKDLILGSEIAGLSRDRDDYLQKQAEAQFAVAEDGLVDAVRKVLARHNIKWG
jgi:histidyl-tRNA synthetase